jgi:hypothetical protein
MVDVLDLDKITIIISGDKVAEIDCCHLVQRSSLSSSDSSTCKKAKEAAKGHGAQVLERAKAAVCVTYPEATKFSIAGQGGEEEGRPFEAILMAAYSVLLHQHSKSKLLRQGADKAAAALHLEVREEVGPASRSKKGLSRRASTSPELPVMLQTTNINNCYNKTSVKCPCFSKTCKGHLCLLFTL